MFDFPTTAFLSAPLRAFFGGLLLLTAGWLFYRLSLPLPEFDGQRLDAVFRHLVARVPTDAYWTNSRTRTAQHWLTLDCYFALTYSALLSLLCGWLSQAARGAVARVGALLSWLLLFGVVFDLAENAALAGLLVFSGHTLSRALAGAFGLLKWLPALVAAAYVLWWLAAFGARKMKRG